MAGSRSPLGVILVVVVLVLAGGAGAGYFLMARGGGRPATSPSWVHFVALDAERAVESRGGVAEPFVARGVARSGSTLAERWRWTGPVGQDVHPWAWARRGDLLIGEFHPTQGSGPRQLEVFDFARGHVGTLSDLAEGAFGFIDDHLVVAAAGGRVHVLDAQHADAPHWEAPFTPGPTVTWVSATPAHAIVYNSAFQVFDRARPGPPRTIAGFTDVVGIAAAREEVLLLRGGQVVVTSLNDGADRITLDLGAGQPVTDGLGDPCLLGSAGGRWLLLYSTTLDQVVSATQRSYSIPAPRFIAAVDPATGQVAWRTPVGQWDYHCNDDAFRFTLATDRELAAPILLHATAGAPSGWDRGHLAVLDPATGAQQWEATYGNATLGGSFFVRHGAVVYARLGVPDDEAIVRFEAGRLTGAVRVGGTTDMLAGPSTAPEGAWLGGQGWAVFAAPNLRVAGRGGQPASISDASAWAVTRFGLPPAAH